VAGLSPSPRALLARAAWRARPARPERLYAQLRESQWWPPERLHELQVELLRDLLEAASRTLFYDPRLRAAGLVAQELGGIRDLGRLPPLERDELQREGVAGLRVPGRRGILTCSSGSTGAPVSTIWPREMIAWFEANDRRCNEWFGVRVGERRLNVAGSPSARTPRRRAGALLSNVVRVNALDLADPRAAQRCAHALERDPPALVWGVSNSLYALALAVVASGQRIPARVCISEGNRLLAPYREALEEAFGCRVVERYGSWETGILAHECPEAGSLHVLAEGVLVEVVDERGAPAAPGTVGHVLVTSLRNRGLPLLRYRIGDLVEVPPPGACPCGRGLPVLGRLIGRSNELLYAVGGGLVPPEAVSAVMTSAAASVVEFQVIQQEDFSLDVKLVQRGEPAPEAYRRRIAAALDGLVRLPGATRIEPVERIPLTGAGKLRHVASRASPSEGRP
jgi:phenylacetate-CoA ligase